MLKKGQTFIFSFLLLILRCTFFDLFNRLSNKQSFHSFIKLTWKIQQYLNLFFNGLLQEYIYKYMKYAKAYF